MKFKFCQLTYIQYIGLKYHNKTQEDIRAGMLYQKIKDIDDDEIEIPSMV